MEAHHKLSESIDKNDSGKFNNKIKIKIILKLLHFSVVKLTMASDLGHPRTLTKYYPNYQYHIVHDRIAMYSVNDKVS